MIEYEFMASAAYAEQVGETEYYDNHFFDTYAELLDFIGDAGPADWYGQLGHGIWIGWEVSVVCRDYRSWPVVVSEARIVGDIVPDYFTDWDGRKVRKVPKHIAKQIG